MKSALYFILIPLILSSRYSLTSLNSIGLKLIIAKILDLLIIGFMLYFSVIILSDIIDNYIDLVPNTQLLIQLSILAILFTCYFSFFRKLLYLSMGKNNNTEIQETTLLIKNKFQTKVKVSKGEFKNEISRIPFLNHYIISEDLSKSLNPEDITNIIFFETKTKTAQWLYALKFLIPGLLFYIIFNTESIAVKTTLYVLIAIVLFSLDFFIKKLIYKIGVQSLKQHKYKEEIIESYRVYESFVNNNP